MDKSEQLAFSTKKLTALQMDKLETIFTESDADRDAALERNCYSGSFPGWPPWLKSPRYWIAYGSKPPAEFEAEVGAAEYRRMGCLLAEWKRRWEAQR